MINLLSDGQFSHMDMVIKTHPQVIILHAATDDNPHHPNQVILSTLTQFFGMMTLFGIFTKMANHNNPFISRKLSFS